MSSIDDLAARLWQQALVPYPTFATMYGVHDHDDRMGDATAAGEDEQRTALLALREEVDDVAVDGEHEVVVRDSMRSRIDEDLLGIGGEDGTATRFAVLGCEHMNGPHTRVVRALPQVTYPEPAHAAMVADRYADVARFLDESTDRFAEGLALGITPVGRNVQHVVTQLDAYVAAPLDEDPLLAVGGPDGWDGETAWRDTLRDAVRDEVRPALARYRDRVAAEQLPHGRDDEHPGLCHVDDGELYARLATAMTSIEIDPDELHRVGREHIDGQLAREWSVLGASTLGESDPTALMDRLRDDESLAYASTEAMLEHAEAAVDRARGVMGDWFGRLPDAPCRVEPIPAYLSASSPAAYYYPPATDGSRPGTYFVNALDTSTMQRTEGEAMAFHEAIPGHHLQLAIAGELEDVPAFMRHGTTIAYAEGWGLYAERLADEMGLYASDHDRLGMLSLDAFRAARLVVDTGLHVMGWSRQQAIDWMTTHTPMAHDTIANEVDRYIAMPGQALAYKVGQREIFALRAEAEEALGDRFDIRGFHDVVLGSGMLTLPVLRGVLERWIDRQR